MATLPTVGISETSPAGSDALNLGDNSIREFKTQNRELMEVDHVYPSSGQSATGGYHKQVHLTAAADIGTGAAGLPILGAQTVAGKGELVYTDVDNNDVQITTGGKIATLNLKSAVVADMANLMALIYPVGSVYINVSDSTNPGTLLGIGTWVALGAGRMIVGFDSGDTAFDTAGETGGANTVTLTTNELPAHTHTERYDGLDGTVAGSFISASNASTTPANSAIQTGSTGSGAAFSVLNKYVTCYTWKRTA